MIHFQSAFQLTDFWLIFLIQVVLIDLQTNSKIAGLLPYLVNFVSAGVKVVSLELYQLTGLLYIIDALLRNQFIYLGPYVSISYSLFIRYCILFYVMHQIVYRIVTFMYIKNVLQLATFDTKRAKQHPQHSPVLDTIWKKGKEEDLESTWCQTVDDEMIVMNLTWGSVQGTAQNSQEWKAFVAARHASKHNWHWLTDWPKFAISLYRSKIWSSCIATEMNLQHTD